MEHESDGDTNCNWRVPDNRKRIVKRLDILEIGQEETIQTKTLLRSARILRRVLEAWRNLQFLKLKWKTANAIVKNFLKRKILLMIVIIAALSDKQRRCPRTVMVNAIDCGIVISEFVLQSRYYVPFRATTLEKRMNSLILPAMG